MTRGLRGLRSLRVFTGLLYFVFLGLGIYAAYHDKMAVALFFAITCAGESIGVSIDYWPSLQNLRRSQKQKATNG